MKSDTAQQLGAGLGPCVTFESQACLLSSTAHQLRDDQAGCGGHARKVMLPQAFLDHGQQVIHMLLVCLHA